jgi:hypothetical protein
LQIEIKVYGKVIAVNVIALRPWPSNGSVDVNDEAVRSTARGFPKKVAQSDVLMGKAEL